MSVRSRAVAGALVVVVLLGLQQPTAPAGAEGGRQEPSDLTLTAQTTLVQAGGAFSAAVLVDGVPRAAGVRVTVHDRVRTRSELARAHEGTGLRASVGATTYPLGELALRPDGGRLVTFPLEADGRSISTPGVYPVTVEAVAEDGEELDALVTDLVVRPTGNDDTPPLAVALVAQVGTELARPPRATAAAALAGALEAAPDVTATLAVGPALLDDLLSSSEPDDVAAVDALRAAAADHPVLALPYAPVSPDALADAGVADELPRQLDRGTAVLEAGLGTAPSQRTWFAAPDLGTDGLRLLSALGVADAVVPADGVEGGSSSGLSPARPFLLAPPRVGNRRPTAPEDPVQALIADARLARALHEDGAPALIGAHSVAELAMLWFEQPGVARAVVAPVDTSVDPATIAVVLDALRATELFEPVALDDAFAAADPLEDGRGATVRRNLTPDDEGTRLPGGVADAVHGLRADRASVQGMVGPDAPELAAVDRHLLRATAVGLSGRGRQQELSRARAAVEDVAGAISTPESVTITLTARRGTVPLTIRNDTGRPVDVQLRFRSSKLELPGGETRAVTLTDRTTRLDIDVRARTSGALSFDVEVTSPDGELMLASTIYSVRSTAVSGVGLGLSIGAGVFLIVWWARHWRASRNEKLVGEVGEPADNGPA